MLFRKDTSCIISWVGRLGGPAVTRRPLASGVPGSISTWGTQAGWVEKRVTPAWLPDGSFILAIPRYNIEVPGANGT